MDKESNNLFDNRTKKEFDMTQHISNAVSQSKKFMEEGISFLKDNGFHPDSPGYENLLNLYVRTAENAYQNSLQVYFSQNKV